MFIKISFILVAYGLAFVLFMLSMMALIHFLFIFVPAVFS